MVNLNLSVKSFINKIIRNISKNKPIEICLGEFKGVKAYLNGDASFISHEMNYVTLDKYGTIFTGLKYQCVEYARRWLVLNKQITFESIDCAYQIWNINKAHTISKLNQDDRLSLNAPTRFELMHPPCLMLTLPVNLS